MRAEVGGAEIFFDIEGAGWPANDSSLVERPVVFLLHGGPGGDHSSFKPLFSRLADCAQLVYVDHRGSGRSSTKDADSQTMEQNIDDVDALRKHLGLDRIFVLGSSYGGMVAQGYAIKYPDHLTGLILVATAPSYRFMDDARQFIEQHGSEEQQRVCQWLWDASFSSDDQLAEYYRAMGPLYARTFDAEKFEKGWHRGIRNFDQLNRGFGGFLRTFDFMEQLAEIRCQTLVLGGAHDWICGPHHSQQIAARIPRAHLKIFPDSAHSIPQDETTAFFDAVRGFVTHLAEI